jgi:hypothetical protein
MEKIKVNEIDLDAFLEEKEKLAPDTDMYRLAQKIKDCNPFTGYPSWFEEIIIPQGTVASSVNWREAWNQLRQIQQTRVPVLHPVHTVDTLLSTSDVKFENGAMVYTDDNSKPVVINNTKGYFCINPQTSAIAIASAHVADALTYYARPDKEGNCGMSVPKIAGAKLKMLNILCIQERKKITLELTLTRARDGIYGQMMKQPRVALKWMSDLCQQNTAYMAPHPANSELYFKLWNRESKRKILKENAETIYVPFSGPVEPPPFIKDDRMIDQLFDFLNRCRMIRGENKGIGILTMSYVFGCLPRSIVKYLTFFLDIKQCLTKHNVDVIFLQGTFPDMVIRLLVRNGYYVVSTLLGSTMPLTKEFYDAKKYGVYSRVDKTIPYGIFHDNGSKCHNFKGKKPIYCTVDVMSIFNISVLQTDVRFHALRAHMAPDMKKQHDYSYLPCSLAHNAQVICLYPPVGGFDLNDLASRSAIANYIRNDWVITKRLWYTVDKFRGDCGYLDPIIIPMTRTKIEKEADYSGKSIAIDCVDIVEVPMGMALPFKDRRAPKKIDEEDLIMAVIREMAGSNQIEYYVTKFILAWPTNTNYMPVTNWKEHTGKTYKELIDILVARSTKNKSKILKGYDDANEEIRKIEAREEEKNNKKKKKNKKKVKTLVKEVRENLTLIVGKKKVEKVIVPKIKEIEMIDCLMSKMRRMMGNRCLQVIKKRNYRQKKLRKI